MSLKSVLKHHIFKKKPTITRIEFCEQNRELQQTSYFAS